MSVNITQVAASDVEEVRNKATTNKEKLETLLQFLNHNNESSAIDQPASNDVEMGLLSDNNTPEKKESFWQFLARDLKPNESFESRCYEVSKAIEDRQTSCSLKSNAKNKTVKEDKKDEVVHKIKDIKEKYVKILQLLDELEENEKENRESNQTLYGNEEAVKKSFWDLLRKGLESDESFWSYSDILYKEMTRTLAGVRNKATTNKDKLESLLQYLDNNIESSADEQAPPNDVEVRLLPEQAASHNAEVSRDCVEVRLPNEEAASSDAEVCLPLEQVVSTDTEVRLLCDNNTTEKKESFWQLLARDLKPNESFESRCYEVSKAIDDHQTSCKSESDATNKRKDKKDEVRKTKKMKMKKMKSSIVTNDKKYEVINKIKSLKEKYVKILQFLNEMDENQEDNTESNQTLDGNEQALKKSFWILLRKGMESNESFWSCTDVVYQEIIEIAKNKSLKSHILQMNDNLLEPTEGYINDGKTHLPTSNVAIKSCISALLSSIKKEVKYACAYFFSKFSLAITVSLADELANFAEIAANYKAREHLWTIFFLIAFLIYVLVTNVCQFYFNFCNCWCHYADDIEGISREATGKCCSIKKLLCCCKEIGKKCCSSIKKKCCCFDESEVTCCGGTGKYSKKRLVKTILDQVFVAVFGGISEVIMKFIHLKHVWKELVVSMALSFGLAFIGSLLIPIPTTFCFCIPRERHLENAYRFFNLSQDCRASNNLVNIKYVEKSLKHHPFKRKGYLDEFYKCEKQFLVIRKSRSIKIIEDTQQDPELPC